MNLSGYFVWLVVILLWLVMLATLLGTYFWRIPLTLRKAPSSASTKSFLGVDFRISLRICLTQILPLLSSMIPFSNKGRCRRGGTKKWRKILNHHGPVFLMSQSRSRLTATLVLGGCLYPANLALLGTSITQLRVLNVSLFIMLRLWRGRIDPKSYG